MNAHRPQNHTTNSPRTVCLAGLVSMLPYIWCTFLFAEQDAMIQSISFCSNTHLTNCLCRLSAWREVNITDTCEISRTGLIGQANLRRRKFGGVKFSLHAQSLVARILPVVQSGLIPMGPQYDQQAYEAATVLQLGFLKKVLANQASSGLPCFLFWPSSVGTEREQSQKS